MPQRIAGFVLPIGSTMCMNGTAIFEGITVIFLAEIFGVDLSLGQMAIVMVMSVHHRGRRGRRARRLDPAAGRRPDDVRRAWRGHR